MSFRKKNMRRIKLLFITAVFGFLVGCDGGMQKISHVIDESKSSQYLYVINAYSGKMMNDTLTLDPSPFVLFFSDRPHKKAGQIQLNDFLEKWSDMMGSGGENTPTATLSILGKTDEREVSFDILNPEMKRGKLIFDIRMEKNTIPKSFGPASLFIDRIKM